MVKKNLLIILLSIILLTGCETKSAVNHAQEYDYTNVAYVESKTTNDITTTTKTTTAPIINTTTSTTTTTTTSPVVNTTTNSTTKKTTVNTTKTTTQASTTQTTTTQPVVNKPKYTGPTTNELVEEAKAYIVKYRNKIDEMIELINIERAKEGLSPVEYDYQMTLAATVRSLEMHYTGVFEHARYCPDNKYDKDLCRKWSTIFGDLNITHNGAGENIARGFATVSGAMKGFMNSESHRKNIMNPKYKYVGIGIAEYSQTSYYFSQEFKA